MATKYTQLYNDSFKKCTNILSDHKMPVRICLSMSIPNLSARQHKHKDVDHADTQGTFTDLPDANRMPIRLNQHRFSGICDMLGCLDAALLSSSNHTDWQQKPNFHPKQKRPVNPICKFNTGLQDAVIHRSQAPNNQSLPHTR